MKTNDGWIYTTNHTYKFSIICKINKVCFRFNFKSRYSQHYLEFQPEVSSKYSRTCDVRKMHVPQISFVVAVWCIKTNLLNVAHGRDMYSATDVWIPASLSHYLRWVTAPKIKLCCIVLYCNTLRHVYWTSYRMNELHDRTQLVLDTPAYWQPVYSGRRPGVTWSHRLGSRINRAAAFWTRCNGSSVTRGRHVGGTFLFQTAYNC